MPGQYEELSCPFCDKGRISCLHFPGVTGQRTRSTSTFGRIKERTKSSDIWLVRSGCSNCGKSQEEVEKKLKRKDII